MNHVIEAILYVITFFVYNFVFSDHIFLEARLNGSVSPVLLVIIELWLTVLTVLLYMFIRNRLIFRKIRRLSRHGQRQALVEYYNSCLKRHPSLFWVWLNYLMQLIIWGSFSDYCERKAAFSTNKWILKGYSSDMIVACDNIVSYFYNGHIVTKPVESRKIKDETGEAFIRTSRLLMEKDIRDPKEMISETEGLLGAKVDIIRSAAALLLSEMFSKTGDIEQSRACFNKAMEFAPSDEVRGIISCRNGKTVGGEAKGI